ncbi:PIG-L family deacetylase [Micrococcales bacterium 31B]|nr:PIG-L family deacetylase [Micrococcales bacterium 31B]
MPESSPRPLPAGAPPFRRIVAVHAHPDDETITMGGTCAAIVATGGQVTVVTCTRGERGEVMPGVGAPGLEGDPDALGAFREGEIAGAMQALGVTDQRFLGDAPGGPIRRFTDSGMAWAPGPGRRAIAPPDMPETAWCHAPLDEALPYLVQVLREVQPDAILTYEPGGGYGHPDHVRAHDVTVAAARELGLLDKLWYNVIPESDYAWSVRVAHETAPKDWQRTPLDAPRPARVIDDAEFAARGGITIDVSATRTARLEALSRHATQARVQEGVELDLFAMTDLVAQPLLPREYYVPAVPAVPAGPAAPAAGGDAASSAAAAGGDAASPAPAASESKPAKPQQISTRRGAWITGLLSGLLLAVVGVAIHRWVLPVNSGDAVHYLPVGLALVFVLGVSLPLYIVTLTQRLQTGLIALVTWLVFAVILGGPTVGGGTLVSGYAVNPTTGAQDFSGVLYYLLSLVAQVCVLLFFWVRRLRGIIRDSARRGAVT